MHIRRKFAIFILLSVLGLSCIILGTPTPTPEPLTDTPEIPTDTSTPETPTDTPTPAPPCPPAALPIPGWQVYCNDTYEFYVQYPPDAALGDTDFNFARIDLSIVPDTNLSEKYLEIIVHETSDACSSALAEGYPPERVERKNLIINGINYVKESGADAGAGNIWDWIAYTTGRSGLCVSFNFVLHSTNPYNYPTPPPEFAFAAETAVFEEIVGSFNWYAP